jgi:hypothetical protein
MLQEVAAELGAVVEIYRIPGCDAYRFWWYQPTLAIGRCAKLRAAVLSEVVEHAEGQGILFLPSLRTPLYQEALGAPIIENDELDLTFGDADRAEAADAARPAKTFGIRQSLPSAVCGAPCASADDAEGPSPHCRAPRASRSRLRTG